MNLIEKLTKEREYTAQVAYHRFMLHTKKNNSNLFCFYEGKEDSSYYITRLRRFTKNYENIICGNRDSVLKAYHLISIHKEYDKYLKAFFIDRDFHPSIELSLKEFIYETPCYSIENLYVSSFVFQELLKNEFHLSEIDKDFETCLKLFKDRQQEFHNAVLLINAWYACLIDLRNLYGINIGINLEKKLPKDFIKLSLEKVELQYNLTKIKVVFPNAIPIPSTDLETKIEEFQNCDQVKMFRGKYEMEFFIKFIRDIVGDSNTTKKFLTKKSTFNIIEDQVISQLSQYAETPNDLIDYIKKRTKLI